MPRRRRHQEVEMPAWVTEEVRETEKVLVPVPRREEAKKYLYNHAPLSEDDGPWYVQKDETRKPLQEEEAWYEKLVKRLASHLSDMIYLKGADANVDEIIENWLSSNKELSRAVMIKLLSEEDIREALFDKKLSRSVVNSVVRLIFS